MTTDIYQMKYSNITQSELDKKYDDIKKSICLQLENYTNFLVNLDHDYKISRENSFNDLGISINWDTGRIKYTKSFKPLFGKFDIIYIRHGKTIGNTEPRIFQGQVDYPENQLNESGKIDSNNVAKELMQIIAAGTFKPQMVFISPLNRCQETSKPFLSCYKELKPEQIETCDYLKEMSFGQWDNQQVISIPKDSIAHLFYLNQNAVVKATSPFFDPKDPSITNQAENFIDVLLRVKSYADYLNEHPLLFPSKGIESSSNGLKQIVIFAHSMIGAALSIMTGNGKMDEKGFLGFDGKYIMEHGKCIRLQPKDI